MIYKMIRVDIADLLNFIAASHVTNLLKVQPVHSGMATVGQGNQYAGHHDASVQDHAAPASHSAEAAPSVPVRPKQSSSMLQRLLKKLTGK